MKATYKSMEELPITLNVEDIQKYLGISRAMAYNLLRSDGFPTLLVGTRKIVPRDAFLDWLKENTGKREIS